mmetsp:Transcript_29291/g.52369  ORF Transcript_29291/g.52369 Transcript_29291/m.52369 type:complete len:200 (-) Transcript_29291:722-1321(-)
MPHSVRAADKAVIVTRVHRVARMHQHRVQVVHHRATIVLHDKGRQVELRLKVYLFADFVPKPAKFKAFQLKGQDVGRAVDGDALDCLNVGASLGALVCVVAHQDLAGREVLQRLHHRVCAIDTEAKVQKGLVRVGLVLAVQAFDLTTQAAPEDLVDESSLGDLGRRAWRHALQTALMQRIEKTAQVLMRVLLPPKPKAS